LSFDFFFYFIFFLRLAHESSSSFNLSVSSFSKLVYNTGFFFKTKLMRG